MGGSASPEYLWSPLDGLSSETTANPVASPTLTNVYYLQLIDAGGCGVVDAVTVYLSLPSLGMAESFVVLAQDSVVALDTVSVEDGKSGATNFISSIFDSRDSILINTSVTDKAIVDLDTAINVTQRLGGNSLSDLEDYETFLFRDLSYFRQCSFKRNFKSCWK